MKTKSIILLVLSLIVAAQVVYLDYVLRNNSCKESIESTQNQSRDVFTKLAKVNEELKDFYDWNLQTCRLSLDKCVASCGEKNQ